MQQSAVAQDFPPNPPTKEGYLLEFSDEFAAKDINLGAKQWIPYYLPQWSSRENSATNYVLKAGQLILKIDEDQRPWCPEFNGDVKVSSLQTGVFSGPLHSPLGQHQISPSCQVRQEQKTERVYTPQYGYFEIRARAIKSINNVCAFWMIGFEEVPEESAEICLMEVKGQNIQASGSINGYGVRAFADPKMKDEFYEQAFAIDATAFHIYAAEWTPSGIDFFIDNEKVRSIQQSPDYPMQFMLNVYEVPVTEELGMAEKSYPKEFAIDYVRAFQPVGGYPK